MVMTVRQMAADLAAMVAEGNGERIVYMSRDPEGNGFNEPQCDDSGRLAIGLAGEPGTGLPVLCLWPQGPEVWELDDDPSDTTVKGIIG